VDSARAALHRRARRSVWDVPNLDAIEALVSAHQRAE